MAAASSESRRSILLRWLGDQASIRPAQGRPAAWKPLAAILTALVTVGAVVSLPLAVLVVGASWLLNNASTFVEASVDETWEACIAGAAAQGIALPRPPSGEERATLSVAGEEATLRVWASRDGGTMVTVYSKSDTLYRTLMAMLEAEMQRRGLEQRWPPPLPGGH